jgi:hypothetical protein
MPEHHLATIEKGLYLLNVTMPLGLLSPVSHAKMPTDSRTCTGWNAPAFWRASVSV